MSNYLDQEQFEDKPQVLIFNNGDGGVVKNCKITVEKKGSGDNERAPEYKIIAFDAAQKANTDDSVKVYPVNKGFFYKGAFDESLNKDQNREKNNFTSQAAETYAVNELKHLLKTFGHEVGEKGKIIPTSPVASYNDFLNYTMNFIKAALDKDNSGFTIAVDYGDDYRVEEYLRMNGFPWYIGKDGDNISNRQKAILTKPKADSNGDDAPSANEVEKEIEGWG